MAWNRESLSFLQPGNIARLSKPLGNPLQKLDGDWSANTIRHYSRIQLEIYQRLCGLITMDPVDMTQWKAQCCQETLEFGDVIAT